MIKIFFLIKTGKRTRFSGLDFYGNEAVLCEIKADKVKYKKILKKLEKMNGKYIIATGNAAKILDFSKFEKYTCYTPEELIYDNFDIIFDRYIKSYGLKNSKISLGITAKNTSVLKKADKFGDMLKFVCVYGCIEDENGYAEEFFKKTGINVILRSPYEKISCDFLVLISSCEGFERCGSAVLKLSDFAAGNFSSNGAEAMYIKQLINNLN